MTNREYIEKKIRDMSDEELANFLLENVSYHIKQHFPYLDYPFDKNLKGYVVKCLKWDWDLKIGVTGWLKDERKED